MAPPAEPGTLLVSRQRLLGVPTCARSSPVSVTRTSFLRSRCSWLLAVSATAPFRYPRTALDRVTGAKVKTGSLDGTDIDQMSLDQIPIATLATGLAKVTYKSVTTTVPARAYVNSFSGTPPSSATGTARCDPGQSVLGGGAHVDNGADAIVNDSHPDGTSGWTAEAFNDSFTSPHSMTVYAICAPVTAVG